VLADMEMAPMDGLSLVRAIRASPDKLIAMLPIVVVTAHSTELKVAQARDAGATEFVTKPFSVRSLAARLEEAIVRPRPYIRTERYFGPDRRRHADAAYAGPERRVAEPQPVAGPPKVDFDDLAGGGTG
jgi:two-component system, chemotaxis family, chemotaxis protein CheY